MSDLDQARHWSARWKATARRYRTMLAVHRDRDIPILVAARTLEQALQGPWSGYPGRVHTERYYTVPAAAVEAFRRALGHRDAD